MNFRKHPNIVDWYFDFISPFAYLQHELLLREQPQLQRSMRPVLFAGLLKHWGGRGPAEIPAKRTATYLHCKWLAEKHGLAMRFPPAHPFNSLALLRLALVCECEAECITRIFRALYVDGADPSDFAGICERAEIKNPAAAKVNHAAVKQKLHAATEDAIARGVFGVPTIIHDDQIFWGLDMTEMALSSLRAPETFRRGEYARLAKLPVAAARKI